MINLLNDELVIQKIWLFVDLMFLIKLRISALKIN